MRSLGGLILRVVFVSSRCPADSPLQAIGLAAALLATRMVRLAAAFRHTETFSPELLRHGTAEGAVTGIVVTHDLFFSI